MTKRVKKAVTKAPVMKAPQKFTGGPRVPAGSVVQVDTKGVGDVVEAPEPVGVEAPGGGMSMPEVAEADIPKDMTAPDPVDPTDGVLVSKDQAALAVMAARIAELEAANEKLANQPIPADQGQIVRRKNNNPDLVQRTAGGNIRITIDPSDEFVAEQAAQEVAS